MSPLDPVILFFLFGLGAGLLRSELKLPAALYDSMSVFLLLAIGLKGGQGLASLPLAPLLPQMGTVIVLGVIQTLLAYAILRGAGRFSRADAASTAAHYGSVSVATFAVAVAWLGARNIDFEPQMSILLAIMEIPAILVGIALARGLSRETDWRTLGHEAFLGKGVTLLLGGMMIGWAAGPEGLAPVKGLFFDLFKGVLALFLLEMGLIVSRQVGELRRHGVFLIAFGLVMPLLSAMLGLGAGMLMDLSVGGLTLLATLAASASYIAVPAAMRIAVPEASPVISLAGALGVTFPFNILAGIPLYFLLATKLSGAAP
ncbi:MAG: sodium-dependent bicarbonate transport family permease [Methylobacterium sp.]|nr:sodium-dependent bicarbonate transport family permease [Methylobacterium sp.]